jgi:hypothetical protein
MSVAAAHPTAPLVTTRLSPDPCRLASPRSTDIAGVPEMLDDGVEGFLFAPGDAATAIRAMHAVSSDPSLRSRMAEAGRRRFSRQFDLEIMVEQYRQLLLRVAPPTLLVDMDGVAVDWDRGFEARW